MRSREHEMEAVAKEGSKPRCRLGGTLDRYTETESHDFGGDAMATAHISGISYLCLSQAFKKLGYQRESKFTRGMRVDVVKVSAAQQLFKGTSDHTAGTFFRLLNELLHAALNIF